MSGFAALICPGGSPDPATLEAMIGAMSQRARWGHAEHRGGPIAIARLGGEVAGAPDGEVPALEREGVIVALDGWLANHAELAAQLDTRGIPPGDASATDFLRRAWRAWGRAMLPRLEGEFAFVLWDARTGELVCARDHQGLRPLHWHWDGRRLAVASEVAGVLAALSHQPVPNLGYLAEHMADEWYSLDETPWRGVMRVPPAHAMRLSAGGPVLEEYWQLPTGVSILYRSDAEYFEHYREILTRCVSAAAHSSSPLGCEVSGGLDSSAVFCVLDRLERQGDLPAPALVGFTMQGEPCLLYTSPSPRD